ncbi:caspase family protein [Paenibacillus dendritiformis]|uniref:caspase family protein n=1 Tax=Paenibacillus dendritiformis TaxID=130049 RepID=UPI00143D5CA1|nr:caspase family protein [Paenibacillus dendritiformis]NKI19725.1 caspase family protein [Paenibacillus dendritiformis]NRG00534.1 caspase family protein [Paenibacillus dendritiformis]
MTAEKYNNTYAVIVAVENYQFGIKKVDYAKNDAQAVRQWLIDYLKVPHENIKLWIDLDATKSALTEELRYEISRLNESDQFIFYYAGHGFFDSGYNKITTWDTHPNNLKDTTVSLNHVLMEPLRKSKCNKSLIFIDACASKIDVQFLCRDFIADMNPGEFINFVRSSNYRAMFISCSRGEKSYGSSVLGHGIWTHFLLKALKGEAPEAIEQERFITSTSLQNYLSRAVPNFIKSHTEIRGTQKPWAEVSCSNTFIVFEIPRVPSRVSNYIDYILIPERLIIDYENDLIMAPLRNLQNDGRTYPMFDFEGLKEVDVEAFCVRISKLKTEIIKILDEIIEFLMEYEWEEEVYFEKDDDKSMISASLYEDIEGKISISLSLHLHISGFHPMGDIIFESEYKTESDELKILTDSSDYNLDADEIQVIFSECWNEIRRFFLLEKEFEKELLEEINK